MAPYWGVGTCVLRDGKLPVIEPTGGGHPIPVSIVTGFLGSGKTTLISRILRDPLFGRTAIIVNEFGEIGLDHELIASSDDSVLTLNTGCLCCSVQTDLAQTLMELFERREAGTADYDRVLIETSGLSDPAPMLQAMIADKDLSAIYRVDTVATLVDSVHGEQTLRDHVEARHQVALADHLLLSKTDLQAPTDGLLNQLKMLNPSAPHLVTLEASPSVLFGGGMDLAVLLERLAGVTYRRGHGEIENFAVIRERPLPALALTLLLQALADHCGMQLLRMKGLVSIEEMPGQPAVIHGVRHVFSKPEFLDHWPSNDERTRMVFITKGVPRHFVARLLDAIEAEVCDVITLSP